MRDPIIELRDIARQWKGTRDRIVRCRDSGAEAALFSADQGTHTAFLKAKDQFDAMVAGIFMRETWAPEEIEGLSELVSGWNSRVQAARISLRNNARGGGL